MKLQIFIVAIACWYAAYEAKADYAQVKEGKIVTTQQKKNLFEKLGCKYSHDIIFDIPKHCLQGTNSLDYYKKNKKVFDGIIRSYAQDIQENTLAPMYLLFISPKVGYGVFALQDIEQGQFIGNYSGVMRSMKPYDLDIDYAWDYLLPASDGQRVVIDGEKMGNELRFINHASDPNTARVDVLHDGIFYVCYVATKKISAGKQITVSYGKEYWISRGIVPEEFVVN